MHPNLIVVKSNQKQEEFKLRIAGMELGKYSYSIDCDKSFFELAEIPDVQDGNVDLRIEMEILEKMILIDLHFKGEVILPCNRCLEPVAIPLDFSEHLVVKLIPLITEKQEEDNLWMINENEYELDLFHFVYETLTLALPIQVLHPDDENGNSTCNPLIMKKLEELSREDNQQKNTIDPRWEALKNIKMKK